MAAHVLVETGRDPSYLIGGEVRSTGTNAAWGEGEWLIVEADESDRSFLKLSAEVAVVTNVELDHHATFATLGELQEAFDRFTEGARVVIDNIEEPEIELLPLGSRFTALGTEFELSVPGRHNVLNALAAVLACREAGVEPEESARALRSFAGAGRRFEAHGRARPGSQVYDDYAHHPTEVKATLEAARTLGAERVVACFQPHLYSRTRTWRATSARRSPWQTSRSCWTSIPHASAPTTSRASAAGWSPRRPPTPPAAGRCTGRRGRRRPSGCCVGSCAKATRF